MKFKQLIILVLPLLCFFPRKTNAQDLKSLRIKDTFLNIDKDNIIYKRGRVFEYNYSFKRQQDTLKIAIKESGDTYEKRSDNNMQVDRLQFKVVKPALFGRTNTGQSELIITAVNSTGQMLYRTFTGLVENKYNVWLHPPRRSLFGILELNPFPYIQLPAVINKKWSDTMTVSDHWSNPLWKVWEGNVDISYTYVISRQESVKFRNQELLCWVVESQAHSRLGKSTLVSFFNEKYGFILLKYQNIDGSETTFSLI
jgi:hypothetical protein